MKSYKDLEIYNLSYDLAIKIHKMSLALPKYEPSFFLDSYNELGAKINTFIQYVDKNWK